MPAQTSFHYDNDDECCRLDSTEPISIEAADLTDFDLQASIDPPHLPSEDSDYGHSSSDFTGTQQRSLNCLGHPGIRTTTGKPMKTNPVQHSNLKKRGLFHGFIVSYNCIAGF